MSGWIKLYRDFQNWGWYSSINHRVVFLDLLLNANHKKNEHLGVVVDAGQLTTSYEAIAKRTGLTIRNVRTVIKDLKSTNEVTHTGMRNFSIITITKWEEYQSNDIQADNQVTSKRQASDKQVTTNKNVKNEKNEKNIYISDENVSHDSNNKNSKFTYSTDYFGSDYSANWILKKIELKSLEKLISEYGRSTVEKYIESVGDYCESSGRKYNNYISATKNFMRRDGIDKLEINRETLDIMLNDTKPDGLGLLGIIQ